MKVLVVKWQNAYISKSCQATWAALGTGPNGAGGATAGLGETSEKTTAENKPMERIGVIRTEALALSTRNGQLDLSENPR